MLQSQKLKFYERLQYHYVMESAFVRLIHIKISRDTRITTASEFEYYSETAIVVPMEEDPLTHFTGRHQVPGVEI